jgi:hypothetical protein
VHAVVGVVVAATAEAPGRGCPVVTTDANALPTINAASMRPRRFIEPVGTNASLL